MHLKTDDEERQQELSVWVAEVKLLAAVSLERIFFQLLNETNKESREDLQAPPAPLPTLSFNSSCLQRQLSVRRFDTEERCNDSHPTPQKTRPNLPASLLWESVWVWRAAVKSGDVVNVPPQAARHKLCRLFAAPIIGRNRKSNSFFQRCFVLKNCSEIQTVRVFFFISPEKT